MGDRKPVLCAGILALVMLLGGCSGDDGTPSRAAADRPSEPADTVVQPGAPGEPSRLISGEEAAVVDVPHTADDVDFMQGMIHHHAQALVMTDLAARRSAGKVALMAERIDLSQRTEMEVMEAWLRQRGEPVPSAEDHAREHGPHGELMPGMVGQEELDRLAAADGAAFDARFVRAMMRHHRGALAMVADLRAGDGGQEPEIDAFARHVDADQGIEINRLETLRAGLPSPDGDAAGATRFEGASPALCILA